MKTMKIEEIIAKEKAFIMPSYERLAVAFERGEGCYLYDAEGKKYLDLTGAVATCSVGYANEAVANAIARQAKKIVNASNLYYSEAQAALAEKMARLSGLGKSFFSNSGSESVEAAIKLARKHTGKKRVIAAEHAFHGRTCGALSATWKKSLKDFCEPLLPGVQHVPYGDADALRKAIGANNGDTAAFIVEPIQGEAGVRVPPKGYLKEAREACSEKDVLLVCDEVQTSMRTGKWFAFQHENVEPDIVAVAKGIANGVPIGITVAASGIEFGRKEHGSTFGGNALACAAGLATIEFAEQRGLVEKAKDKGEHLMGELKECGEFSEVRGLGLMVGAEMKKPRANEVVGKLLEQGVLLNATDEKTLRFLPPLVIEDWQLDEGIEKIGVVVGVIGELND